MALFLGLFCIVGGFIAVVPIFIDRHPGLKRFDAKLAPYKIVIGLAVLIVGVITFVVPYHSPGRSPLVPIFGDFIPSVLAMLLGALISIEFFETLKGVKGRFTERTKEILHKYQYPIGFAGMLFGILHWFLFRVVFF